MVIAHHRRIQDPLYGAYTVKLYKSEKRPAAEGEWRHERILLCPDSDDPSYRQIVIEHADEDELSVIAELITVLD